MEITALANCNLVIFDLDGTLYAETHHFLRFGEALSAAVPDENRALFLRDASPFMETEAAPYPKFPDTASDPWQALASLSIQYGIHPDEIHRAFLATRDYMASPSFVMTPLPGLEQTLTEFSIRGIASILMTNSPEPCSRAILAKLGLQNAFVHLIFDANKPHGVRDHYRFLQDKYAGSFERMLTIGDNYANEIEPAIELGMKTVLIDRYELHGNADVAARLGHPSELAGLLRTTIIEQRPSSLGNHSEGIVSK